jgi:hypothetical protein
MFVFFAKLASFAKPRDKPSKRGLRMGCLGSGSLNERKGVVISSIMIVKAQRSS